jgi:hypothetical protein
MAKQKNCQALCATRMELIVNTTDDPSDIYDLVCLVGTGNFGHVWQAVSQRTNESVALKIVPVVDRDTFLKLMQVGHSLPLFPSSIGRLCALTTAYRRFNSCQVASPPLSCPLLGPI